MTARPLTVLFLYGTLKRGQPNHAQLAGQTFVGEAETSPDYSLYQLDGYPGLVHAPKTGLPIRGEVWRVDEACLRALDRFEGTHERLYRRERIALLPPYENEPAEAYFYVRSTANRRRLGSSW